MLLFLICDISRSYISPSLSCAITIVDSKFTIGPRRHHATRARSALLERFTPVVPIDSGRRCSPNTHRSASSSLSLSYNIIMILHASTAPPPFFRLQLFIVVFWYLKKRNLGLKGMTYYINVNLICVCCLQSRSFLNHVSLKPRKDKEETTNIFLG